jgi:hypothetical protein
LYDTTFYLLNSYPLNPYPLYPPNPSTLILWTGTLDPTPHLYDTTFYTLGGLMTTAFVAHALVRPMKQQLLAKPVEEKVL